MITAGRHMTTSARTDPTNAFLAMTLAPQLLRLSERSQVPRNFRFDGASGSLGLLMPADLRAYSHVPYRWTFRGGKC